MERTRSIQPVGSMDRRVVAFLTVVSDNQSATCSAKSWASSVGLSESRLRHLIKRETGMSLGAVIRAARMERARELLTRSFLNIKQITYELGLHDERYFIREFKRAYGITPGAYRQRTTSGSGAVDVAKKTYK